MSATPTNNTHASPAWDKTSLGILRESVDEAGRTDADRFELDPWEKSWGLIEYAGSARTVLATLQQRRREHGWSVPLHLLLALFDRACGEVLDEIKDGSGVDDPHAPYVATSSAYEISGLSENTIRRAAEKGQVATRTVRPPGWRSDIVLYSLPDLREPMRFVLSGEFQKARGRVTSATMRARRAQASAQTDATTDADPATQPTSDDPTTPVDPPDSDWVSLSAMRTVLGYPQGSPVLHFAVNPTRNRKPRLPVRNSPRTGLREVPGHALLRLLRAQGDHNVPTDETRWPMLIAQAQSLKPRYAYIRPQTRLKPSEQKLGRKKGRAVRAPRQWGIRLRALREAMGITVKALAQAMGPKGLSKTTILNAERSESYGLLSAEIREQLAQGLGLDAAVLLGYLRGDRELSAVVLTARSAAARRDARDAAAKPKAATSSTTTNGDARSADGPAVKPSKTAAPPPSTPAEKPNGTTPPAAPPPISLDIAQAIVRLTALLQEGVLTQALYLEALQNLTRPGGAGSRTV